MTHAEFRQAFEACDIRIAISDFNLRISVKASDAYEYVRSFHVGRLKAEVLAFIHWVEGS